MSTDGEPLPGVAFARIQKKAELLGIKAADIGKLKSVKELRAPRRPYLLWTTAVIAAIFAILYGVYLSEWPVSRKTLFSWYFKVVDLDLTSSECAVPFHDGVLDLARPPLDCSFCRGITKVHRVSNISPEEFEKKYAYSGQPVIITDATKNWTALSTFSFKFFKEIYSKESPALANVESNCQFFPYKTNFGNLREVFEMDENRANLKEGAKPWYIGWSNCDSSAANILRQHYTRPYFLPLVAESSKTDWIFMGSPGYGAHMHIDNVGKPSWQAQIVGNKTWKLEPPSECYFECSAGFEATVLPGEIIVLDTNSWFHSTLIVGNDMSIVIGSEYD